MYRKSVILILLIIIASCGPKPVRKPSVPIEAVPVLPSAYIIKEKANIRSEASTSSGIVTALTDGDEVFIMQNQDGWYQIHFEKNKTGWIRSDLVGPRNLSRTILARAFVDSTLPAFKTELYFDTQELYKVIYMVLPAQAYSSKSKTAEEAKKLGRIYQDRVYPGDLEIRVMKPDSEKELFMKVNLEAINIADVPVPVLKHGRLYALETPQKGEVRLWIIVPTSVNNAELLAMARSISGMYGYPFSKAEIYLVEDSPEGLAYLRTRPDKTVQKTVLRLYYLEDKDGEYFQYDVSGNTPATY